MVRYRRHRTSASPFVEATGHAAYIVFAEVSGHVVIDAIHRIVDVDGSICDIVRYRVFRYAKKNDGQAIRLR